MPSMPSSNVRLPGQSRPIGWIIALSVLGVFLISALIFGFWAFAERNDYKNNVDQKIAVANKQIEKETTEKNNKQFAEESKKPLKKYVGPSSYGTVTVEYPKTWSAYITTGNNSSDPLVGYFHPDYVPTIVNSGTTRQAIALKIQVANQAYDTVVKQYDGQIQNGEVVASSYALPKMSEQVGMKFTGKIDQQLNGTEIILPLRDKTLIITTETDAYLADFNNYILPNLTYVP